MSLRTKSYGVTIQMKPLQQYFCMEPFVFQNLRKSNLEFFVNSMIFATPYLIVKG